MQRVIAIQNFEHGKSVKKGDVITVSDRVARDMRDRGLVRYDGDAVENPVQSVGEIVSPLPADQALPQETVKRYGSGGKKKKGARSFASIPASE